MSNISQKDLQTAVVAALPRVWRFAMSLSGRADMADDLSQNTCLRALERRHQVTDVDGVSRWLMTICRSLWYNELRSQAVRKSQSLDTAEGGELVADILPVETNIYLREVLTKVMTLPEAQRSVVMLVLVEGYAYREAAEILDVPIGTIMSRLSSARAKLGKTLGDGARPAHQEAH